MSQYCTLSCGVLCTINEIHLIYNDNVKVVVKILIELFIHLQFSENCFSLTAASKSYVSHWNDSALIFAHNEASPSNNCLYICSHSLIAIPMHYSFEISVLSIQIAPVQQIRLHAQFSSPFAI